MCARRFLFLIFWLTLLAVAGAFAVFQYGGSTLTRMATPKGQFAPPPPRSGPDYAAASSWLARPGDGDNAAGWLPSGVTATPGDRPAATFYIHPTTYLERDRWNAALDPGGDAGFRARLFVQSQASAFNNVSQIWAPRYRQAAFGAFLLKSEDAAKALDLAYRDVLAAFDNFIAAQPGTTPIILAGHSQGALHLSRLLVDRRAVLGGRLVAAYVVGWPLSISADLPATGLAPCTAPDQAGCVLSWQSFAEPANPSLVLDGWTGSRSAAGVERKRGEMLCTNPISGTRDGVAAPQDNLGTLAPSADLVSATLVTGQVGARCEEGFLMIDGALPRLGSYVLPGNNYHVYDYALFWGSIRADAERRLKAFRGVIHTAAAEFAAVASGRLGGLDVGTRTIGLATCDATWSFATPAETIRRTKFAADLVQLRAFIARHSLSGLVIGLPLNLDGSDSPRTQSVRAFARNLLPLGLPLLLWDERWSTVAVERTMIEADMSRARRAEKIDSHAAAHILQAAIDALSHLPR